MRRIWFDILTPKHFWFFTSLAEAMRVKGYEILVTARRYEQLTPLLEAYGRRDIHIVGEYGGGTLAGKLRRSIERSLELMAIVEDLAPDCCVSSGSPEASRIAYGLGMPHILISDTPHSPVNPLTAPISRLVMSPWVIGRDVWRRYGVPDDRIVLYRGLDPLAWLEGFQPNRSCLRDFSLREDGYILVRPPEYKAAYLAGKVDMDVFTSFCSRLVDIKNDYEIVLLPRYLDEVEYLRTRLGGLVKIIERPVYGPSILYYSSLLVGGGGTMTQEAALLGVPNLSVYPLEPPPSIKYLADEGLVRLAPDLDDALAYIGSILPDLKGMRERLERRAEKVRSGMVDPKLEITVALERVVSSGV